MVHPLPLKGHGEERRTGRSVLHLQGASNESSGPETFGNIGNWLANTSTIDQASPGYTHGTTDRTERDRPCMLTSTSVSWRLYGYY